MPTIVHDPEANSIAFRRLRPSERKKYETQFGKMVRISREDYEIIYCSHLCQAQKDLAGLCVPSENKIYVNVSIDNVQETLLHEIFHAEFAEGGLRQTDVWSSDLEELVVETLSKTVAYLYLLRFKGK